MSDETIKFYDYINVLGPSSYSPDENKAIETMLAYARNFVDTHHIKIIVGDHEYNT